MNNQKPFKPTRLYIKRHIVTGLKYFGKSIVQDIISYRGSGMHWRRHLKIHGDEHVVTDWVSDWFYNPDEIKTFALSFSDQNDIVKSQEWANQRVEDGLEGGDTFAGKTKEEQCQIVEKRMATINSMTEEEKARHRKKNSDGVKQFIRDNPDKHLERSRKGSKIRKENGKPWHSDETKAQIGKNNKSGTPGVRQKISAGGMGNTNRRKTYSITDPSGVTTTVATLGGVTEYCLVRSLPVKTLMRHVDKGLITNITTKGNRYNIPNVNGYRIDEIIRLSKIDQ